MTSKPRKLEYTLDTRLNNCLALINKITVTNELLQAYEMKKHLRPDFPIFICIIGGTGAGKSLLFNSLVGSRFSEVGVRRPCTRGAVICSPSASVNILRELGKEWAIDGTTRIVTSDREYLANIILVDTPDFDSVEKDNVIISDRFFILSDVILFVASEEKYADLLGRNVIRRSLEWGKEVGIVLNKSLTENAFNDFSKGLNNEFGELEVVKIGRIPGIPEILDSIAQIEPLVSLFSRFKSSDETSKLRTIELHRLRSSLLKSINANATELQLLRDRVANAIVQIQDALTQVTEEMESRLQVSPSHEVEQKIQIRLGDILRKYDVLYVPRAALRSAVEKIVSTVRSSIFSSRMESDTMPLIGKFAQNDCGGPLPQLDASIAKLNLRVAEILLSTEEFSDFRRIVSDSCPRFTSEQIETFYQNAFPEVEHLLEAEFEKFKDGLSTFDEIKLYGSYTLWSLFLITAEITIGGGLTLLDVALNTVIVPFIPKWLLKLKIIDILRDIAQRIDDQRREALRNILRQQAYIYIKIIIDLAPSEEAILDLVRLKNDLENFSKIA
ncbi:MAG: GTPase [Desulfomonile sp.]